MGSSSTTTPPGGTAPHGSAPAAGSGSAPAPAKVATRDAYGKALAALGAQRTDIVVLDADLSGSTKTNVFAKQFPGRFLNMGVAEANMIGVASGLASTGLTVFCSSFAMFASGKTYEQIRQEIALPVANVKICATHAGLTVGEDGASHQMLEDLALMRVLPNMTVIAPADGTETEQVIAAVAEHKGPCYVRLSRMKTPQFLPADYRFQIGRAALLRRGDAVTLIGTGVTSWHALRAADLLAQDGIEARVLNLATIKPLDLDALAAAATETAGIVTVEEHQRAGGLGGAVAEAVSELHPCRVLRLGMNDRFGESGDGEQLLEHFGLTAPAIAAAARKLLARS
jgi:transketolase